MLPHVELVELDGVAGDDDLDAPAETLGAPRAIRPIVLGAVALAAVALAGVAVVGATGVAPRSHRLSSAPPSVPAIAPTSQVLPQGLLPPTAPQAVTAVAADLGSVLLRSAACYATSFCVLLPDVASAVVRRLGPFATGHQVTGATMITAGDRILGRGAEVTVAGNVVARLVVVRATTGPSTVDPAEPAASTHGVMTTSVRRGSWQLTATLSGPVGAALPLVAARDWVANSALPG